VTVTNDTTTNIGKVRSLIQDPTGTFFSDEEIEDVFLGMNDSKPRLAAADALEAIANNQVLLLKKIELPGPLRLDGPAVAKALREGAMALRQQELGIYSPGDMFDVIEVNWDENAYGDIMTADILRSGL